MAVTVKDLTASVVAAVTRRRRERPWLAPLPKRWDRQVVVAAPRASELVAGTPGSEAA